jgi:hypothetical protein
MRRIPFLAVAIAAGFMVVSLAAQKSDFSGKWTLVPDPAAAAAGGGGRGGGRGGGGGGFCGPECTITQDATSLTVTRTTQAGEQKATYKLDGSESKNPGRGGAEVVSKAAWEGNRVVIQASQPGRDGGAPTTVKQTISMAGGQLEVETDAGRGAQKQVYKKN